MHRSTPEKLVTVVSHSTGPDVIISPGRFYVDGILCEIEATPVDLTAAPSGFDVEVDTRLVDGRLLAAGQWVRLREGGIPDTLAEIQSVTDKTLTLSVDAAAVGFGAGATMERVTSYRTQPHLPDPPQIDPAGTDYVAYLEVWQRNLTEVEDPGLREPALGGPDSGPDTTTRAQTVWQLRLDEIDGAISDPECSDFGDGWLPAGAEGIAELRVRSTPTPEGDECNIPPEAGYRGAEHQLYRVEIHADSDSGTPTFKWSRDNGSVVYPITGVDAVAPQAKVTVASLGRDAYFTIKEQDVVEAVDDVSTLTGTANDLYRVQVDPADLMVTLDDSLPGSLAQDQQAHPLLRRWDHRDRPEITIAPDGAVEIQEDTWLPLEAGVEVMFRSGSTYKTGDYWLIPARAGIPEGVIWPTENTSDEGAVYQNAHGIERDYCVVGLVVDADPEDCRPTFPPLTELELLGCCRRIEVGDDIQAAIDEAIANGGGCLCLARGTHLWSGELRIHGGHHVTLHGEPGARLLLTADESEASGISVKGSHRIGIGELFIGGAIPWLVRLRAGETGPSRQVDLFNLRMFNPTVVEGQGWAGGVLLTGVENLRVNGCTVAASTGLMSLATVSIPGFHEADDDDDELAFHRVKNVGVHGTHIRYHESGITALAAHRWTVENSRIDAVPAPGQIAGISASDDGAAEVFESAFELLISGAGDPSSGRVATESILWVDSWLTDSVLEGVTAMNAGIWARGGLRQSSAHASELGVEVGWLQEVLVAGNRIDGNQGAGLAFGGAFRSDIDENVIRGREGIVNVSAGRIMTNLVGSVTALANAEWHLSDPAEEAGMGKGVVPWWLVLEEISELLGLRGLVDAIDSALGAKGASFPILLMLAGLIHEGLDDLPELGDGPEIPIVDLVVDGNDINSVGLGLSLQHFLPLGGLRVQDNRVLAEGEQAIVVNSGPIGRNTRLLGAVGKGLIDRARPNLPNTFDAIIDAADPEDREAFQTITKELLPLIENALTGLERMLETDYRIERNSARTCAVVIETNLYEVVVSRNHVTQEQSLGFQAVGDVLKKLEEFEETKPIAFSIVEGTPVYAESYAYRAIEELPARAFVDISRCLPPQPPPSDIEEPPDTHRVPPGMPRPEGPKTELPRSLGGPAIWAKSPGITIAENTVIVPPDSAVESWGWGGILAKGDEPTPELFLLVVLAMVLGVELTSLAVLSESLITDNEVAGGHKHGVRVAEVYLPLPGEGDQAIALVSEVRIAGNQIRNMGGAGIALDETASAVGVDISGNVVRDCSFDPRIIELGVVDTIGGIVGSNCAFVKVHANRVSGCGDESVIPLFGVEFERVVQLSMSDNTVIHSGSTEGRSPFGLSQGGIKAELLMGAVSVADNDVTVMNTGVGILIAGFFELEDWVISPTLVVNLSLYLQATGAQVAARQKTAVTSPQLGARAKVTDNQVTGVARRLGFGLIAGNLADLVMTGNSVRGLGAPSLALRAGSIREGVIGNNLADQITLGQIDAGTITGNRSTLPINLGTGGAIKANNS